MCLIHRLFEEQVARTPDTTAVVFGERKLSFEELDSVASGLAVDLVKSGVVAGDRVPILLERSLEMVVSVLGVLKAGAAYVPIDPNYPEQRINYMLLTVMPKVVISNSKLSQEVLAEKHQCLVLENIKKLEAVDHVPIQLHADSPAYVIFTSGSTGNPKGVTMSHGSLAALLKWQSKHIPLEVGERTLQFTSLSFDVSFQEIFTSFTSGGTLVLVDNETRRDPDLLLDYIELNEINRLYLPFIALQQLAEVADARNKLPEKLREVITAGEQLQATAKVRNLFKRLKNTRLHNHYGPSETHVVTAYTLPLDVDLWEDLPPIGQVIDNSEVLFVDDSGNSCDPKQGGELYFGGACLATGYFNNHELTSERFIQINGKRYYKTGDLGRQGSDGNIFYLGRSDNQVKIRGHRVELGEIETYLSSYSKIKECVVSAIDRAGEKELVAFIVTDDGYTMDLDILRNYLRKQLAEYLIPSEVKQVKSLPLTPSGKIDRKKLSITEIENQEKPLNYVAPKSGIEEKISTIWSEILGRKWISSNASFFDVGGTSLNAVKVRTALQQMIGKDIPLTALFQYPTVSGIASYLKDGFLNNKKISTDINSRASKQRAMLAKHKVLRNR